MGYEEELKQKGLKNTPHRNQIMEFLNSKDEPVSAKDIYKWFKEEKIYISLSTIYRTLEVLLELGFVRKLNFADDNSVMYESARKGHCHYLICLKCKKKTLLDKCPFMGYQEKLEKETNFVIEGHKLDIYGYCPNCK